MGGHGVYSCLYVPRTHVAFSSSISFVMPVRTKWSLQRGEEHVYVPPPLMYINHSCAPNCRIEWKDDLCVVQAIEDIHPGDELVIDYLKTEDSVVGFFECKCGTPGCRGFLSPPPVRVDSAEPLLDLSIPELNQHVLEESRDIWLHSLRTRGFILIRGLPSLLAHRLLHRAIGSIFKAENRTLSGYRFDHSLFGVSLPFESESVSAGHLDAKTTFDIFPLGSYTYQYYYRKGVLATPKNDVDLGDSFWNDLHTFRSTSSTLLRRMADIVLRDSVASESEVARYHIREDGDRQQNDLLRLISYPQREDPGPNQYRLGPHKDDDLFAIVANCSRGKFSGLQIMGQDRAYTDLTIPDHCAILVAGQLLEILTRGTIIAPMHQVIDSHECRRRPRHSLNYNLGLPLDSVYALPGTDGFSISDYYAERENKYQIVKTGDT